MARWEEVLDIQLDVHNWLSGPYGQKFGGGYFESAYRNPVRLANGNDEGSHQWSSAEDANRRGREWATALAVNTFNAEPIWVDPDMMTVVEMAITGFTPEPLLETDLITPNGFLVLPRSLWLTDPGGRRLSWKMAVWFPTANGINLTLIHDTGADPDDMDVTPEELRRLHKASTTRYLPTHVVNWPFGDYHPGHGPSREAEAAVTDLSAPAGSGTTVDAHAQLQATWRLLTQYLAVTGKQRPPRAFLKRAQKAKMVTEHVTIVRLRRPPQEREPGEPQTVHWTHRWLVGGHWRSQWYASLGIHRQIWVSPYVKGPKDMPLIANKARVFEFIR